MPPISEAQKKATMKYMKNNYDRLEIKVPKGRKEAIQATAQVQGESLNGFVTTAIDERIARLESTQDTAKTALEQMMDKHGIERQQPKEQEISMDVLRCMAREAQEKEVNEIVSPTSEKGTTAESAPTFVQNTDK